MTPGFVYVIESPSDTDLLEDRTEGRSLCEALRLANIPHRYNLVTTERSFVESLGSRLEEAMTHFEQPPILHLSMHGDDQGIELTNGKFITWEELRQLLIPLNNIMKGGLLICMSSCFGGAGCRMAMNDEKDHSYWAIVGNSESALWSAAAVAYITFYHLFFRQISLQECVEAMCIASGDKNFLFLTGDSVKANWTAFRQRTHLIQALQNNPSVSTGGLLNLDPT